MATDAAPPGIDRPGVDAWLAAHVPDAVPPFTYEPIAGGGSNLTFRVADAPGHQWALRRPPIGPLLATAHDMGREVRLISALAASPVPVPACAAFCQDPEVTGAPFYVMDFVDGLVIRDLASTQTMTRDDADRATDSLIDTQIALHTLDLEAYGLADLARHGDYVGRQLTRWRRQVEAGPTRDAPLFFELHERLVARKPTEQVPPGLAHGDYRFDNVVLDEQFSVAAVLDWELCTIGDPIADFAWSLEYWANENDPVSFLRDPPTAADIFVTGRKWSIATGPVVASKSATSRITACSAGGSRPASPRVPWPGRSRPPAAGRPAGIPPIRRAISTTSSSTRPIWLSAFSEQGGVGPAAAARPGGGIRWPPPREANGAGIRAQRGKQ